jgi:hypothetical protein
MLDSPFSSLHLTALAIAVEAISRSSSTSMSPANHKSLKEVRCGRCPTLTAVDMRARLEQAAAAADAFIDAERRNARRRGKEW